MKSLHFPTLFLPLLAIVLASPSPVQIRDGGHGHDDDNPTRTRLFTVAALYVKIIEVVSPDSLSLLSPLPPHHASKTIASPLSSSPNCSSCFLLPSLLSSPLPHLPLAHKQTLTL